MNPGNENIAEDPAIYSKETNWEKQHMPRPRPEVKGVEPTNIEGISPVDLVVEDEPIPENVVPVVKLGKREKDLIKEFNRIEHDNRTRVRTGKSPSEKGLRRQHKIKVLLGSIKTLGAIEFH